MEQVSEPARQIDSAPQKMSKGQIIGMVVLTIIALAGVAFGVFGMIGKNEAEKNLAIKITEATGKVTDIVTDKITSVDENGTVTEITDTNAQYEIENPIIKASSDTRYSVGYNSDFVTTADGQEGHLSIQVIDGKVSRCSFNYEENCVIDGLSGDIYKMVDIVVGNGAENLKIGFIMTDGSVYYLPRYGTDFAAKKINIDGFVKDIVDVNSCPQNPGPCTAYTVFVLSDNSLIGYSENMF